jgi:hypothetical protein
MRALDETVGSSGATQADLLKLPQWWHLGEQDMLRIWQSMRSDHLTRP